MSSTVFGDTGNTPGVDSPTTQTASPKEQKTGPASKTDAFPFGKKPGDSPLGTLNNNGPDTSALLRQMLVLVAVILVLGAACWFVLKKGLPRFGMTATPRSGEITVLETASLPSRQRVYLLRVGSKKLLLSGGKDGLQMLADVTDGFPEQPTDDNFQTVLSKQADERNEGQAE